MLHAVPEPRKFTESFLSSEAQTYLHILCVNYLLLWKVLNMICFKLLQLWLPPTNIYTSI